jgi:biotin carboxyl carrier protein
MTNYSITIDTEKFNLNRNDVVSLDIISIGDSQYHLLQDNQSYTAQVLHTDFPNKSITLVVNGNIYSLKIADEYDQIVDKMGMRATRSHQINEVRAPMPGMIMEVLTAVGQKVDKGTPLIVLSAMKMENIITSPGAGTVKKITTEINKAVEKGEVIIEME